MLFPLWPKLANWQFGEPLRQGHSRTLRSWAYRPNVERLEKRELLDGNGINLAYGQIPLSFEANHGQTEPQVNFLARGNGYAFFLTPTQAVLSLQKDVLRMQLAGGSTTPQVIGLDKQATTS